MGTLKKNKFFYGVLFLLCLIGFFSIYSIAETDKVPSSEMAAPKGVKIPPPLEGIKIQKTEQPQKLESEDIEIHTAKGEKLVFHVEMAKTYPQQRKGMMFRDNVDKYTGMLFLFPDVRERSFWMKNTWVALDIIFIRPDGIIHHIHPNAEVKNQESIKSNGEVSAVLEIGGGEAARLGIAAGDRIAHDFFE